MHATTAKNALPASKKASNTRSNFMNSENGMIGTVITDRLR